MTAARALSTAACDASSSGEIYLRISKRCIISFSFISAIIGPQSKICVLRIVRSKHTAKLLTSPVADRTHMVRRLIDLFPYLIIRHIFKVTQHQGTEILTNPDPVTVTGKKEARDFVYINLNGGDSWAYFFPTSNPDILHNFKGEPCMYMWDVDKDIYNEYRTSSNVETTGSIPFGFLWPNDDSYYRGFANPDTNELIWLHSTGSKSKLRDFYVQNGVQPATGWAVDEWQLNFDPTIEGKADFGAKEVNTYKKTEYLKQTPTDTVALPPMIKEI